MKYFKIKPQFDNKPRYTLNKHGFATHAGIFVGNELYTEHELKKYVRFNPEWLEPVNVSRKQTYIMFGARFSEMTGGYSHE